MEKQNSIPLSPNQKKQQQNNLINITTFTRTLGCISPYTSRNDLSTNAENELFTNRILQYQQQQAQISSPTLRLKTIQYLFQENRQYSPINESRKYSVVYNYLNFGNKDQNEKTNSQNSSVHCNKEEVVIESLSSKKSEKLYNKKKLLAKQITRTKLNTFSKLIGYFGILSIWILISSTVYFHFDDKQNVLSSNIIFNKLSKSFQIALDMFNFATEQTYSKLLQSNQLILKIDNLYTTSDIQFQMTVVYGNVFVFEESQDKIQSYILSQNQSYFEFIKKDQSIQIFITVIGALTIFLLAFPFSLYLQKKKANLLKLLGSFSPQKLEEYMNKIQISLEKIGQLEYENYIKNNTYILNQLKNKNEYDKGEDNQKKSAWCLKCKTQLKWKAP